MSFLQVDCQKTTKYLFFISRLQNSNANSNFELRFDIYSAKQSHLLISRMNLLVLKLITQQCHKYFVFFLSIIIICFVESNFS